MVDEPDEDGPPPSLLYRLFGYWIRRDACRLAAQAVRSADVEDGWAPRIWSLTVFFETYLCGGAGATIEDFGPKEPADIKEIGNG